MSSLPCGGADGVAPVPRRWAQAASTQPRCLHASDAWERLLQGGAQRVPQASSRLSKARGRGSISDACRGHRTGSGGAAASCVFTLLPELSLGASLLPGCLTGGPLRGPGTGTPSSTLPRSCHLFTRWKYFCRKPGSTVLLQSSSCVRG